MSKQDRNTASNSKSMIYNKRIEERIKIEALIKEPNFTTPDSWVHERERCNKIASKNCI